MSKMGDMYIEILEMLEDGLSDHEIRKVLGIPQEWIDSVRLEYAQELEYDDSMDGDHASGLASIGWGTDEDYE